MRNSTAIYRVVELARKNCGENEKGKSPPSNEKPLLKRFPPDKKTLHVAQHMEILRLGVNYRVSLVRSLRNTHNYRLYKHDQVGFFIENFLFSSGAGVFL